jgi:hypothetical protein
MSRSVASALIFFAGDAAAGEAAFVVAAGVPPGFGAGELAGFGVGEAVFSDWTDTVVSSAGEADGSAASASDF